MPAVGNMTLGLNFLRSRYPRPYIAGRVILWLIVVFLLGLQVRTSAPIDVGGKLHLAQWRFDPLSNSKETMYRHLQQPAVYDEDGRVDLGCEAHQVDLNGHDILDWLKEEPIDMYDGGKQYNPALLALPAGSAWEFVSATSAGHWVGKGENRIWDVSIFVMGLNVTKQGRFRAISDGWMLRPSKPYRQSPGIENPRLFYTDASTIALTFMDESMLLSTRVTHFIADLRDFVPALRAAMPGVAPAAADTKNDKSLAPQVELYRQGGMAFWEKNWLAIYPGAVADGRSIIPYWLYRPSPFLLLQPDHTQSSRRLISHTDTVSPVSGGTCLKGLPGHVQSDDVRNSAGLLRLTLCERYDHDCEPHEGNTVRLGLLHIREGNYYHHFMGTFNVTPPFEPISVGPPIKLGEFDNSSAMLFTNDMTPIPTRSEPDHDPSIRFARRRRDIHRAGVLPDHLFIDDYLAIGFGMGDNQAMTVRVGVKEVLAGQQSCVDLR